MSTPYLKTLSTILPITTLLCVACTVNDPGTCNETGSGSATICPDTTGGGATGGTDSTGGIGSSGGSGGATGGSGGYTGGAGGFGGSGATGGSASGGLIEHDPRSCLGITTVATGSPKLIDDFSGNPNNGLPANDGRAGQWVFENYKDAEGFTPGAWDNGTMHLSDRLANYTVAPWNPEVPWEQWVAASTRLQLWKDPADCYDATFFTGIRFKAKSNRTPLDRIRLQVMAPGDSPETGEMYMGPEVQLSGDLESYEVPFASIQIPAWSPIVDKRVPQEAIVGIGFIVRSVKPESGKNQGGQDVSGETVTEFDITIDDVEFY